MATAYIRVFDGSLGQEQCFAGPMAKQQRMAVLTFACLFSAVERYIWGTSYVLLLALSLITIGSAWTCIVRTRVVAAALAVKE